MTDVTEPQFIVNLKSDDGSLGRLDSTHEVPVPKVDFEGAAPNERGHLLVVSAQGGGSGVTTTAVHMVERLAAAGLSACLLEYGSYSGDVRKTFRMDSPTISDIAGRWDGGNDSLDRLVTVPDASTGLRAHYVLGGGAAVARLSQDTLDSVLTDVTDRLLSIYHVVVIDAQPMSRERFDTMLLPRLIDNDQSSMVVVTGSEHAKVSHTAEWIARLTSLGLPAFKVRVLVNRASHFGDDIAECRSLFGEVLLPAALPDTDAARSAGGRFGFEDEEFAKAIDGAVWHLFVGVRPVRHYGDAHPRSVLMIVGPAGSGKTVTVKAMAEAWTRAGRSLLCSSDDMPPPAAVFVDLRPNGCEVFRGASEVPVGCRVVEREDFDGVEVPSRWQSEPVPVFVENADWLSATEPELMAKLLALPNPLVLSSLKPWTLPDSQVRRHVHLLYTVGHSPADGDLAELGIVDPEPGVLLPTWSGLLRARMDGPSERVSLDDNLAAHLLNSLYRIGWLSRRPLRVSHPSRDEAGSDVLLVVDEFSSLQSVPGQVSGREGWLSRRLRRRRARRAVANVLSDARQAADELDGL